MKVLLVINRLEDNGGAEVSTGLLLRALQGRGVEFTVATLHGDAELDARTELEARGVRFHRCPPGTAARLRSLQELVVDVRPDLLHSTLFDADTAASLVGAWNGVPVLSSVVNATHSRSAAASAPAPWKLTVARWLSTAQLRWGTSHVHAITDVVADEARARLHVAADRLTVVPRGRDVPPPTDRSHRRAARRELALDVDAPVVLNVARHEAQKGHDLLVDAMRLVVDAEPTAVLLIAGREGHETAALRRRIDDHGLGDHIRLLGVRTDVARLHAASDVFAFSSRWEGLGGAVLEAMAAGTPVVAFDVPTMVEVVRDTGLLVPAFDRRAFADAVLDVLRRPDAAGERALRARHRVTERYSADAVALRMAELYARVASMPPPPAARISPRRRRSLGRLTPGGPGRPGAR